MERSVRLRVLVVEGAVATAGARLHTCTKNVRNCLLLLTRRPFVAMDSFSAAVASTFHD